jgi:virulence-associated protein VagC
MTSLKVSKSSQAKSTRTSAQRAKVFWTGRSQAVRLPKEFRFAGEEVTIYRQGSQIILEPATVERDAKGWPLSWWKLAGSAPEFEVGVRPSAHERGDVLSDH